MIDAQKYRKKIEEYLSRNWNLYTPEVKDDFPDVNDYLGKTIDPTYKPVKYPGSKPSQDQKKIEIRMEYRMRSKIMPIHYKSKILQNLMQSLHERVLS